ncbi:NAD-dependent aldehyde dehydrogenase [Blastomyces dermatitidis ATCC 18188]|uniref:NAD-dependent aldehyde dehydrogenase n=1 Tax=Ajellomyces dermatitidis (strain ATCC 18188 / CBS 674.68) TaxID=653446 RepID=F2T721_AJEDA|nr:NAD-dependent aldehyde dehydrogenase [Blastomyces dermatitidis ATCC 18188]EQL37145.1 NAD-dependent aldehyde dehydrogenase [Blastomyces dermatitidis ATCC 26199]
MALSTIPLLLDNQPVITADSFDVISPNTGAVVYKCSSTSVAHAVRAVDSANAAFKSWAKVKPSARRDIFLKVIEIYERRKEELIGYAQEETGSSRMFAEFNWGLGHNLLKDVTGRTLSTAGTVPIMRDEGQSGIVYKEPYGVILSIAPWNAMFVLGLRSIVLPLAAGNTVVLKASELSPKCFWALGDIFREAQLPPGCLNVLYHRPASAAEITTALIAHPAIRKINFTGSTQVGRIIASTAGKYIKPVLLELGGKASTIVLDDADLKKAATGCVMGSFLHGGQICMSTERIIVQRSVIDEFRNHLRETMATSNSNPPPVLVSAAPVIKNRNLVSNAVSKGGNILVGDNISTEETPNNTRMDPIILEGITPDMDIYHTESFGPTVSLYVVDTEQEAIQLANDTEYGLSAAVYTENLGRGLRVAKQLESGAVHINSMTVHDEPGLPHGGVKCSGFGRFGGPAALDEFLTTKSVTWMDV